MSILNEAAQLTKDRLGDDFKHLTVERLVVGLFFTGVKLSNDAGGICFTPIKGIPEAVCCPSSAGKMFNPGKFRGMSAEEVLSSLYSPEPLKVAVAIATLNALSNTCFSRRGKESYDIKMNMDALDTVRMPKDRSVAVVGAIVPLLQALKRRGGIWWVIEQDPKTIKDDEVDHFVPFNQSEKVIRKADVIIVTGATLVNHSLEKILEKGRPEADIAVIGPSASMLPEPLFDRGVRMVGGTWVKRTDELLDVLAAGGSGYHFFDTLADRVVIEKR